MEQYVVDDFFCSNFDRVGNTL